MEGGLTAKQKAATCAGSIGNKYAAQWTARGHVLSKVGGPLPFIFCRRCGAWGSRRARHLERNCGTPTPAGALALRRIENGKHPWRQKLEGGGEAPRANIVVTETYDRSTGSWRKLAKKDVSGKRRPTTVPAQRAVAAVAETVARDEGLAGTPAGKDMIGKAFHSFEECEEDPFGHGGSLAEEPETIGQRVRVDDGSGDISDGRDAAPPTGCVTGRADVGPSRAAPGEGVSSSGSAAAGQAADDASGVGNRRDRGADVAARLAGLRSRVLSRGAQPRVNQGLRGWEGCFPSSRRDCSEPLSGLHEHPHHVERDFSIPLSRLHGHPHRAVDSDNLNLGSFGRRCGPSVLGRLGMAMASVAKAQVAIEDAEIRMLEDERGWSTPLADEKIVTWPPPERTF